MRPKEYLFWDKNDGPNNFNQIGLLFFAITKCFEFISLVAENEKLKQALAKHGDRK